MCMCLSLSVASFLYEYVIAKICVYVCEPPKKFICMSACVCVCVREHPISLLVYNPVNVCVYLCVNVSVSLRIYVMAADISLCFFMCMYTSIHSPVSVCVSVC